MKTRCPACGHTMRHDVRPDTVTVNGVAVTVMQPGLWCDECGEAIFTGEEARIAEDAIVKAVTIAPEEVQRIRFKLGMSQRRAGVLLGGGPRAFQKYESGKDVPSAAMANLLRLLDRHPELLSEIGVPG